MPRIRRLLIANRAEISTRISRTARDMGIETVAVFSDPDTELPYVRQADLALRLPGALPSDTYLNIDAVLEAARITGADAIHPGYGFLSENHRFAERVSSEGLTFVGPSPKTIAAMGSKTAAKEIMTAAGVPTLPSLVVLPGTDLAQGTSSMTYPLLVKAAFGGGGRGMRVVADPSQLESAVATASEEAKAAFGNGQVFIEPLLQRPRHIEVQIFGDAHGNYSHLFERECSIQRRYQKIVEESPSPAVDDDLRKSLTKVAVDAAAAIEYLGAGTVEFIVTESKEFYFLEVNTRLQVEHPVTEAVTGIDLVEVQIRVAQGEELPSNVMHPRLKGHAVEVRLYAEDPLRDYLPLAGEISTFMVPSSDGIRVDAGYGPGTSVSSHYDAMLAKIISWAPTREAALARLGSTLARSQVFPIHTNIDLLRAICESKEFLDGGSDTGFLARNSPAELLAAQGTPESELRGLLLAGALFLQSARRASYAVQRNVPSGWRNVVSAPQTTSFIDRTDIIHEVSYRLSPKLWATVDSIELEAPRVFPSPPGTVELEVGGMRRTYSVVSHSDQLAVSDALHTAYIRYVPRFRPPEPLRRKGSLVSPMPATVISVLAQEGDSVSEGAVLVMVEAMKMRHEIHAPSSGVLTQLRVKAGQQVIEGEILAVVDSSMHDQ